MWPWIKKYRVLIVISLLILIPLFNLSTQFKSAKDLKWYDRVILWVTSPAQNAVTGMYQGVISFVDTYVFLVHVKKENKRLLTENNRLVEIVNNMREIEHENSRLRELLAFKLRYLPSGVTAEVIARDTTSEYQTVRINKGLDVGLSRRMPVITPSGVVGQLINVWQNFSDVLLLTDQNHAVDAIVQRSRARGVIKGGVPPLCELHYLANTDDVQVGDVVVTSGIENIFPKGILIGTVQKVEKKTYSVTQNIEIRPTVNLSKLEEVFIVTNFLKVQLPKDIFVPEGAKHP